MYCPTIPPPIYGFFTEGLPPLLYYSHILTFLVAFTVAILLFFRSRGRGGYILGTLLLTFCSWVVINLTLWTSRDSDLIIFLWSFDGLLSILLAVLSTHFFVVFASGAPMRTKYLLINYCPLIPALIITPTQLNLSGFDLMLCGSGGFESAAFTTYYASVGLLASISIVLLAAYYLRHGEASRRMQIFYISLGLFCFLATFFIVSFLVSYLNTFGILNDYSMEQHGLFGMLFFVLMLVSLITNHDSFNTKIFASEALVTTLWILVGSLLLVVKSDASRIVTVATLILSIIFGVSLVRSVRREVEARKQLAEANEGQERFIHFLSHEVKGFLTVSRNGFAAISQGDLGPVSEEVAAVSRSALERMNEGVSTVENILRSANLRNGKVTFAFAPFDLAGALRAQVEAVRPLAEQKSLDLTLEIPEGEYICVGDRQNISDHVLRNLVENAIYYTEQGSVRVSLARTDDRYLIRVIDTGIGISAEDKVRLFTQGGRGADSLRHNVHSTGHGLFIAKSIVEAHNGTIRATSEGAGKGTTFEVELPVRRR